MERAGDRADRTQPAEKATSKTEMKRGRERLALTPAGYTIRIKPLNLMHHALLGNLPAKLRTLAVKGADGVNELFEGEDERLTELGDDMKAHLDRLVAEILVEPNLTAEEIASGEYLLPVDYRWLVEVAMMEEDRDGVGRLLWGEEGLDRWALFRDRHECPEDCEGCDRVRRDLSAALA